MNKHNQEIVNKILSLDQQGLSSRQIASVVFGRESAKSTVGDILRRSQNVNLSDFEGPKILFFDVETASLKSATWGLFKQNVGLNQIISEWHLLSWAAKWAHEDEVMYMDQRYKADVEDDRDILEYIWKLLDECDIAVGHNSRRFDSKKLNARFIMNGMPPPSHYRQIDTLEIAKKHFAFTSNKLEWLTDKLCEDNKKVKHQSFPGFELWKECLNGNIDAWEEMEVYNRMDVLSLEELYTKLAPWSNTLPNLSLYRKDYSCQCGSDRVVKNGYHYTNQSVFQRYRCEDCGHQTRGKKNLLDKDYRKSQRVNIA